jgi:hypothetical protein
VSLIVQALENEWEVDAATAQKNVITKEINKALQLLQPMRPIFLKNGLLTGYEPHLGQKVSGHSRFDTME